MSSSKIRKVYYNDEDITSETAIKILKTARLDLKTKVFQSEATNYNLPYILEFELEDADIGILKKCWTPQEWADQFIGFLLNKHNVAECLNKLCNIEEHDMKNYQNLIIGVLTKIKDVEVREVEKVESLHSHKETVESIEVKECEEVKNEDLKADEGKSNTTIHPNLVVGDDNCSYNKVCDTLSKCKTAPKLWDKLEDLANDLEIPADDAHTLKKKLKMDTIPPNSGLRDILVAWRGKHANNAKLTKLIGVFDNMNLSGCAVALTEKFSD